MRRRLSEVYMAVENNVHDIERDLDHPDQMFDHMNRIVNQNSSIASCALVFKEHYYPSKGRLFIPFARRDDADSVRVMRVDSTYHSEFSDIWVKEQMQKDESGWTKPYYESEIFAAGQKRRLLATYGVPIHNSEGAPVAMICADLALEELSDSIMADVNKMVKNFEQGQRHHSYFFIVDWKGTIIMHPDEERITKNLEKEVGHEMKAHRGTCVTKIDGVESMMTYRSVHPVGWVMVFVTPLDAIQSNAKSLNIIILAVMLLGLLAIYFICRRQIKDIADPVAMQKANLEHELKIANSIQMALLPQLLPEHSNISLYASLTPARDVGGDLYDYFVHEGRLVFCIGDVSGKGVPAALLMAVMRSMFRSEAHRADSAAEIVETMNRNLCEESTAGYFVTMFVGILNLTTGRLDYCNAGHEQPIVAGQPLEIKYNLPVGALSDWTYEGQQTQLRPGDMLFLYTDGISEAKNTANKLFGRKRVRQLAAEHTTDSPQQLIELMETEVRRHAGDAEQSDDITLLAIKWQPQGSCYLLISASMDDIGALEPFVAQSARLAGLEDREAKRLRLAVEEAVANVINYGQATTITIQASVENDQLVLTINDDGLPFDPTADSPTDFSVPADQRPPGGLGIMYLHKMTDGLDYQRVDGHNVLKIIKLIHKK
ncbi:MAG: SpoIIE family protein phosphatase, partial [Prevotella sp.]|nr:SpoIIE family protein phosphatase [Prevotella sp.]